MKRHLTSVEHTIDCHARRLLARLPQSGFAGAGVEFLVFGIKQAWACLFGAALLLLMILSRLYYPQEFFLDRYDFLFACALGLQILMLATKLETLDEAKVIFIYHVIGTAMEIFKTSVGSWEYPEASVFRIEGVPLFSGFMYAAIGSYIARISRIFDLQYSNYPSMWMTFAISAAIYLNFFSHHYIWDFRYLLFAAVILMYFRCHVHFRVFRFRHQMPMLVGFFLVASFIWVAENVGTWSKIWLYPSQHGDWELVSFAKLGSWYLLMIISFVLVTLVQRPKAFQTDLPKTDD